MAVIELRKLNKSYGGTQVCRNVDLLIRDGEFVTLLGPSGCGKTTTLNIVAGVEDATSGDILMGGQRVNDSTPFQRDIAMVFQNYALYPHMTVAGNIGFTLKLRSLDRDEIERRVDHVAASLELAHLLHRYPAELSGGQQQRVAIGRAMIREPKAFLFDEPFSNLDAALRVKMRAEVKLLHQRLGTTSVFVTHDQEEALSLSDRIAILHRGEVEQFDTPENVYNRPASRYVAQFVGTPQMDFLEGILESQQGNPVFRVGYEDFALPEVAAGKLAEAGTLDLGIRSEHIALADHGHAAQVALIQPIGPSTFVTLAWSGRTLTARVPGIAHLSVGQTVHFSVSPEHLMFFAKDTGRRIPLSN